MADHSIETCNHCGESMEPKKTSLLRKKKGTIYSFTDVPAQVCPECGERWYASETLKVMDGMIAGQIDYPHEKVEAFEFSLSTKAS